MVMRESQAKLEVGEQAPDFELEGTDGETHSLEDFDERAVLLVFTCNHCPYAKAKFDVLNAIAADYDDVAVVGVNPNDAGEYPEDSLEKMREYVADGRVAYDAYLRDPDQSVALAYGARCTPDPFLLVRGEDGLELAYHGRLDDATNPDDEPQVQEMREVIDAVLAGETIPHDGQPSRGCSIKWTEGNEPEWA
jgi:peroxiredoxin